MWKLLKYDIKQSKRTIYIFLGIMAFLIILLLLRYGDDWLSLYAIGITFTVVCFVQFLVLYGNLFSSRCIQDHLVHYTGIKRRAIVVEPILFLLITVVLFVVFLFIILYVVEYAAHMDIQSMYEMSITKSETPAAFSMQVYSMVAIWMFYGGVSLLVWTILSLFGYKANDFASMIVMFAGFVILNFIMDNIVSRFYGNVLLLSISVICILIYYIISMRQDRKYKSY